jgi:glycosidase
MWGADDPDPRKPIVWADLDYDDETTHPYGRPRPVNRVEPDTMLRRVYADLIDMRRRHLRLFVDGSIRWLVTDDDRRLLAYERVLDDERAVVAFNASAESHGIAVAAEGTYRLVYPTDGGVTVAEGTLSAQLPPGSARVWVRE